jgi:CelD/BcsL family acetyltransferase involved in cellulose biosynthesis
LTIQIREIKSYDNFLDLQSVWNSLLEVGGNSVFSTWEWLSTWWKHFGNEKKLVLLVAEENGNILGIAPLMYSVYKMFGLRMGKIEFIGTHYSDYNDFILADKKEECVKLFLKFLYNSSGKWNCIELRDIPEDAQALLFLRRFTESVKPFHGCPFVGLPKSFEALLGSLSARQRKNIKQGFRRLEEDYQVDFLDYSASQCVSDGMKTFFDLHQKRWNVAGLPGFFAEQESRSFHLDVARSFSQKGWLGLFLLVLSGETVAAQYGFKYMGKFYSYLSGFDPEYSEYSVGSLLTAYTMRNCIECGLVEFDFMRGAEEYKNHWNAKRRWNSQAILTRNGKLASLKHQIYREYWRQGNRLKHRLKMKI